MPVLVGGVTLVAGAALVAAPGRATGPLGLVGQDTAMRAIGLADLVLVPGLPRGSRARHGCSAAPRSTSRKPLTWSRWRRNPRHRGS